MSSQLSWSLTDEVAPFFDGNPYICTMCYLIDEKVSTGYKCNDLKERLVHYISSRYDLNADDMKGDQIRRAYEFAKYY
jgi:hypothetical protein